MTPTSNDGPTLFDIIVPVLTANRDEDAWTLAELLIEALGNADALKAAVCDPTQETT